MKKDYSQVQDWKKELVRKIGLFGLSDLRKLAPIGDLGYAMDGIGIQAERKVLCMAKWRKQS